MPPDRVDPLANRAARIAWIPPPDPVFAFEPRPAARPTRRSTGGARPKASFAMHAWSLCV